MNNYLLYFEEFIFNNFVSIIFAENNGLIKLNSDKDTFEIIEEFGNKNNLKNYVYSGNWYFLDWNSGNVYNITFKSTKDISTYKKLLPVIYKDYYDWNEIIKELNKQNY